MRTNIRRLGTVAIASALMAACGGGNKSANAASGDVATPAATAQEPAADTAHHSKLGGAIVGGIVGHELGGHAVAGAAAGALIQHHRNKNP